MYDEPIHDCPLRNGRVPTLDQCRAYFVSHGCTEEDGDGFYRYWEGRGWRGNKGYIIWTESKAADRVSLLITQRRVLEKVRAPTNTDTIQALGLSGLGQTGKPKPLPPEVAQRVAKVFTEANAVNPNWVVKAVLMITRYPECFPSDMVQEAREVYGVLLQDEEKVKLMTRLSKVIEGTYG